MRLGMGLNFGWKKQLVLGVGDGVITSAPNPFYGAYKAQATSLSINSLTITENRTYAPCFLIANLDVSVTGTSAYELNPLEREHLHVNWELKYQNGSAITDWSTVLDPNTGVTRSIYKDVLGVRYKIPLFDYGDFELFAKVYAMRADGFALIAEESVAFSRSLHPNLEYLSYDNTNGNNANDGKSRVPLSFSGGTYTHATGIINAAGAFAGLDLDDLSTVVWHRSHNICQFTFDGSPIQVVVEPIDDNNVRVHQDWRDRIGADAAVVSSSSAPKALLDSLPVTALSDKLYGFCGDNNDDYDITSNYPMRNKGGYMLFGGYGDNKPQLSPDASYSTTDPMFYWNLTFSSRAWPDVFMLDYIKLDGEGMASVFAGAGQYDSGDGVQGDTDILARDVEYRNFAEKTLWSVSTVSQYKKLHIGAINTYYDNRRNYNIPATMTDGAADGDLTLKVTIDPADAATMTALDSAEGRGTININNYRKLHWSSAVDNADGTWTLTFDTEQRPPKTVVGSFSSGTTCTIHEQKAMAVFFAAYDHALFGETYASHSDKTVPGETFDHHVYNSIKSDSIAMWCQDTADSDGGNMFNTNFDYYDSYASHGVLSNMIMAQNRCVGAWYMIEGGNNINNMANDEIQGHYIVDNHGEPKRSLLAQYITSKVFIALNSQWSDIDKTGDVSSGGVGFLDFNIDESEALTYSTHVHMERNNVKNVKLYDENTTSRCRYFAAIDNIVQVNTALGNALNVNTANTLSYKIIGNNFDNEYGGGNLARLNGGSYVDIATFNAAVGNTNTSSDPNWSGTPGDRFSDAGADVTPPTLSSSTPSDDATNVALTADIQLVFDEDIALGTGNIVISDGTDTISIDVANHAGQLSIIGNVLTINPTSDLANNSANYNVQIASTAIEDLSGNAYAGIADATTLDFVTVAVGTPVVVFNPATPTYIEIQDTVAETAYFTHPSQFVVEFKFKTTSTGVSQRLIDGAASGGYNSTYAEATFNSSDLLALYANSLGVSLDGGAELAHGADISAYLDDGEHTAAIRVQANGKVGVIGISSSGTAGFSGQLWDLKFKQYSDGAVLHSFPMNSVKVHGETETDGDVTITYIGFVSGDWILQ